MTREALKQDALAVIVHGSLVLGDYVPGRSDIDLLVVAGGRLSEQRRERVVRLILDAAKRCPNRIDYRVVLGSVAARPTPEPPMALWIEITPRTADEHRVHGPVAAELDLAVELSICRAHGETLLGASPAELLGEVPRSWVVRAGRIRVEKWQRAGDQPRHRWFSVLTACRIWRFAEEDTHCSKLAAGRWALQRDPSLVAVRDALRQQAGDPSVAISASDQARLLSVVRSRLGDV